MYLSACYLVVEMTVPLSIEIPRAVASSPGHSHVFNVARIINMQTQKQKIWEWSWDKASYDRYLSILPLTYVALLLRAWLDAWMNL